jgi:RNA polymerase sigma-70 factor (ECF subfamily)
MATAHPSSDEERFRALFEANARPILGYALRRVADPATAADVVSETFLVAWRRLGEVPDAGEDRLWLFGVARRLVANQRRGAMRRSRLADKLRLALIAEVPQTVPREQDGDDLVRTALDGLGADDRELLRLTSWEGLSPGEVSVVMGIPPGTARSRLHRARARLRVRLEAVGFSGERSAASGHVVDDERVLVRDAECET